MSLAILISSLGKNLSNVYDWLSNDIYDNVDEIIIVVQKNNDNKYLSLLKKIGCKIIIDNNLGLSRSRNICINYCNSDFFWILDDDVYTNKKNIDVIKKVISEDFCDVMTFRYSNSSKEKPYKKYKNLYELNKINLLKVSSIEIVAKTSFVKENNIRFNENFGLGSKYPSCEENLFLLELFDKGAIIKHNPSIVVYHPNISSGYAAYNPKSLMAKGYICNKYNLFGFILLLYWIFKFSLKYKRVNVVSNFIRGYFIK